jgi:hypothetical protein
MDFSAIHAETGSRAATVAFAGASRACVREVFSEILNQPVH